MSAVLDGKAIVYCDEAFATSTGKTAHGLVRKTRRYEILSVLDTTQAGKDAGQVLDGKDNGIPIHATLEDAFTDAERKGIRPSHFVIGIATDGGRLRPNDRAAIKKAITFRLNVDSGLHDFLNDDPELVQLAAQYGVHLRDVRQTPPRKDLHNVTGKIDEIDCLRIAVLGSDACLGKRTTAWKLVDALCEAGYPTEMLGTGQTAWMQGARYGILLDSLINDFVAGELEHACWRAWKENHPKAIVIEGQGSLLNPAYPGGLEILAALRPQVIILQHAPGRKDYEGLPGVPIHPIETQIRALELVSGKPIIAITVNHEGLIPAEISGVVAALSKATGLPAVDVLTQGTQPLVAACLPWIQRG